MALSTSRLGRWMVEQGLAAHPDVAATPISGGQSNPTYRVDAGGARFVLRKKPDGDLLPSAHAIDREYRVMRALQGTPVPVPTMVAWCGEPDVLGTPFYLMDFVEGRVISDQTLPGFSAEDRGAVYRDMNRTLAALHGTDLAALGLGDFGRHGNYVQRQIARWTKQCESAPEHLSHDMRRLMEWLPRHVPARDDVALVHGDYRLDNLVLHQTEPRVIAVLDWELSTIGDPLADFSYHCMSWHIPASLWRGIAGTDFARLGIPAERAYIDLYASLTGKRADENWHFYMAYNLFRMAAILHGIGQRAEAGHAAAADALQTAAIAGPLAKIGWECALRHSAQTSR